MGYRDQNWKELKSSNRKRSIVEFITRDETGAKTGKFKATSQDDYSKILNTIKQLCGYKPIIGKSEEEEFKNEINWLKKSVEW